MKSLLSLALLLVLPQAAQAERTLHVFTVFCNAYQGDDAEINQGVSVDKLILDTIFTEYFSEASWGVKMRRVVVEGPLATKSGVEAQFNSFCSAVGPEDTIYVHFSGHGEIPDPTTNRQHLLMIDDTAIKRDEWADQINDLPCKLKILITDCCSTFPHKHEIAEGDELVRPWRNLYSLLMEHEGFVNITAASPGQPAYATDYGGYLTVNLESDMQRFRSWQNVFNATQQRVYDETVREIKKANDPSLIPQRPFAYSLGKPLFDINKDTGAPEWIIPDSNQRFLNNSELNFMGLQQLYLARNEIFARHGFDFENPFLKDYFGNQPWYQRKPGFKSPDLSAEESANADAILAAEKAKGGPFFSGKTALPGSGGSSAPADIFPYSSERPLSRSIVQALGLKELSIARNEIFARHGYPFQSRQLQEFFARKPGYRRQPSMTDPPFSEVEEHNLWLIRKIERIKGGAYSWE
ncbi:MAG: YARHG domain-containing protein [Verrucomicrobiaceae bacterium]|nr:YARHG domain-containing protein [Verrucomicrobiaceae bacterium]